MDEVASTFGGTARPVIVGQAPGHLTPPGAPPFHGRCERRLDGLLGRPFREAFDAVNLLRAWPGRAEGKGDLFPLPRARREAASLVASLGGRRVLLAGRGVAGAFRVDLPFFCWAEERGMMVAVIPHPSGVSHWWNDPANERRARGFLRREAARA